MNKEFGAGFVTLDIVNDLPIDVYRSWWAYFSALDSPDNKRARAEREAAERAEKDWDNALAQAKRALKR